MSDQLRSSIATWVETELERTLVDPSMDKESLIMRVGILTVLLDLTHSGWLKSEELHKYVKDTNANYVDRVEELEAHVEVLLKSIAVAAKLHNCGADHVCTCCQESWPCGTMKTLDVKEFI